MTEKKSSTPAGGSLNSDYFIGVELSMNGDVWEKVPDEDLWEDGEISNNTCMIKMYNEVVVEGNWKLIRRKDE